MNISKYKNDERTLFIENKSFSLGFKIFTFAILLDIVIRAIYLKEASWDLMLIVILTNFITIIYQYRNKMYSK